jgi:beta-phosphoglucomutase-like phosphatase (HAD superfamily)
VIRIANTQWGIEEGLNAGMWTVGVTTDASLGASLAQAGAHYVISTASDIPDTVAEIGLRMRMGNKP